jgi:hypothetical protein
MHYLIFAGDVIGGQGYCILGISTGEVKHTKRTAARCGVVWLSGNLPSQFTKHKMKLNDRGLLFFRKLPTISPKKILQNS